MKTKPTLKKFLLFSLVLIVALAACNRKAFVSKLSGTWTLNKYIYANQDYTKTFMDTTNVKYQLTLTNDQRYNMSWMSYKYKADTLRTIDTLSHDTILNTYLIDTIVYPFIDTTVVPVLQNGAWVLINSQEDIQLTNDSDQTNPVQYQILKLDKKTLNLLKGNQEYDLSK